MDKIINIDQLNSLILEIRNLREGFVTNFYLDEVKHGAWINTGLFLYHKWEDTIFLFFEHAIFEKNDNFVNLFYISTSEEKVIQHLIECKMLFKSIPYMLDIVGRDTMCLSFVEKLKGIGAQHQTTLRRMIRIGKPVEQRVYSGENVKYVNNDDINTVDNLLRMNFDEQLEQLPLRSELKKMIKDKHILKYTFNNEVVGLLLFDLNTTTLYLKYWLTLTKYRNQRVGSELFQYFFKCGKETKRQILWVQESNDNAIMRYEHFGFKKENMYDYILKY